MPCKVIVVGYSKVNNEPSALDSENVEQFECDNLLEFITSHFDKFPDTARIYGTQVAESNDITPMCGDDVKQLDRNEGVYYIVVYPAAGALFVVAAVLVGVAAALLLIPEAPVIEAGNRQSESSNNSLSNRVNKPRVGARIPDIFGTVRSVPDLLSVYTVYENHSQIEYSLLCVSRGVIHPQDERDDTTKIQDIAGTDVEFYSPFSNLKTGEPFKSIGSPIEASFYESIKKQSVVNGQTLRAPNDASIKGAENICFIFPDTIEMTGEAALDESFSSGDILTVSNSEANQSYFDSEGVEITEPMNFDGAYTVVSASANEVVLSDTQQINTDWSKLDVLVGKSTSKTSATLSANADKYVGEFIVGDERSSKLILNFVAPQGMYKEGRVIVDEGSFIGDSDLQVLKYSEKSQQAKTSVLVEIEVMPIDENNDPVGSPEVFEGVIEGSQTEKTERAVTVIIEPSFSGKMSVKALRKTPKDLDFEGSVVDEVKWRDLYVASSELNRDLGNITTAKLRSSATAGALRIKDRKFNLLATREIPRLNSDGTLTSEIYPSDNAGDILCAASLDPVIGGRSIDELDTVNIYETCQSITDYFGTSEAAQFGYTFDSSGVSYEETVGAICTAVFSTAYRQGSKLKMHFERKDQDPVLLFNHRNKLPNSHKVSVSFGSENNKNGIEYIYTTTKDGSQKTIFLPDESTINLKKVQSLGVTSDKQAHLLAHRQYNKIIHRGEVVEFDATQEADLLVRNDRILVTEYEPEEQQEGEVIGQNGLELTLSHDVEVKDGDVIFLQLSDATIESIYIKSQTSTNKITLSNPPRIELVTSADSYARTIFKIASNVDQDVFEYIITDKSPSDDKTSSITAINYNPIYYEHDKDYV